MVNRESVMVRSFRFAVPLGLLLVAIALVAMTRRLEAFSESPFPLSATRPFAADCPLPAPGSAVEAGEGGANLLPVEVTVQRGQTLDGMLNGLGLSPDDGHAVTRAFAEYADLRRLRPGETLTAFVDRQGRPAELELLVENKGRVRAVPEDGGWTGHWEPFSQVRRIRRLTAEVDGSLTGAVTTAGAPASLAYAMADVLQWDLDFNRDLRVGDRFEVLYEEVVTDGRRTSVGKILALRYDSRLGQGRALEAYRFADRDGYYDSAGRPLAKMFLRSPLRFSRITSRFSRHRFHPILKAYRPHYGVDYGAPVGTPVHATAHGTVTFAGWNGGAGRMIKVRHAKGYLSGYLHLSKIASGVRPGARVSQGQVIGYVGATGLATGPHLDYRVQLHGRWINPLQIDNVKAEPLDAEELAQFKTWRDTLRTSLETGVPPDLPPELQRDGAGAPRIADVTDGQATVTGG